MRMRRLLRRQNRRSAPLMASFTFRRVRRLPALSLPLPHLSLLPSSMLTPLLHSRRGKPYLFVIAPCRTLRELSPSGDPADIIARWRPTDLLTCRCDRWNTISHSAQQQLHHVPPLVTHAIHSSQEPLLVHVSPPSQPRRRTSDSDENTTEPPWT